MSRYKSKPKRQDSIVEESHDETAPLAVTDATETASTTVVAAEAVATPSTTEATPATSETASTTVVAAEATPAPAIPEITTEPTATVTPPSFFRRFLSWIPIVNRWA